MVQSIKRIQRVYYLLLSLFWFSTALPIALMVLLLQTRGIDLFQVGLLMGVYSLTIVLLEVPTGGLADVVERKRVALLAYAFITLSGIGFLFAFSFLAFLLGYVLYGIGRALASGALDAWFIDALQAADPHMDIQPSLAHAGTFTTLALGSGTLLGSLIPRLFPWLPAEGTAVLTPLAMPIVFALLVKVALLIAVLLLVDEERPAAAPDDWRQGLRQVPGMARDAFTLSRLLKKRFGLVSAIFQGIQGLWLVLLALQSSAVTAAALFWLVYLNLGILHSPVTTLINREIPAERRSSMLSVFSLVNYMGGFIGSAGLGYLAEQASISLAWMAAGALLVVSLFLYLRVDRRERQGKGHDQHQPVLETC